MPQNGCKSWPELTPSPHETTTANIKRKQHCRTQFDSTLHQFGFMKMARHPATYVVEIAMQIPLRRAPRAPFPGWCIMKLAPTIFAIAAFALLLPAAFAKDSAKEHDD